MQGELHPKLAGKICSDACTTAKGRPSLQTSASLGPQKRLRAKRPTRTAVMFNYKHPTAHATQVNRVRTGAAAWDPSANSTHKRGIRLTCLLLSTHRLRTDSRETSIGPKETHLTASYSETTVHYIQLDHADRIYR